MDGLVTLYEYDAIGNLTKTTRSNGTVEERTYNASGLLTRIEDKTSSGEIINEYIYTYDERGNITSVTAYDNGETGAIETAKLTSAEMTYDADNRLITYNGEEILYDEEGNMVYGVVNGEMTTLTYDCRNRLVTAGEWHYTYDAENNRISTGNNKYEETYIVDTVSQSLSRVLTTTRYNKTQGSITGVTVTTYIFGNGLEYQKDNTTGKHLYYHYNNIGSTTKLTNQNGEIVEEYTYGAYGELLSGDTEATPYLYNGRYGVSTEKNRVKILSVK